MKYALFKADIQISQEIADTKEIAVQAAIKSGLAYMIAGELLFSPGYEIREVES